MPTENLTTVIKNVTKHDKNLSLLNREKEIHELKVWFKQMQNNQIIS